MQTIRLTPYENSLIGQYLPNDQVVVLLDTTDAQFTVTLPDASSTEKTMFLFTTIGSNNAILVPITGQYINDETSITLAQYECAGVTSFKNKYHIVTKYSKALVFF